MNNKIIIALLFILSFSSCNKYLEVEPTDKVGENIIFSSTKNIETNTIGLYDALLYYYGAEGYRWVFGPDIMGEDMLVISKNNYGRFSSVLYPYNFTQESSRTSELWTRSYRVIKGCNDIVNKIDKESIVGSKEDKQNLKGEALVIRAYINLTLIRLYGEEAYSQNPTARGIPLDTLSVIDDQIGRSKVEDAYKLIISDLKRAVEYLDVRTSDKWRMDKLAAYAILARTYLDMGEWKLAAESANNARGGISDGSNLMDEVTYTSGFNTENVETLWEHAFIQGQTFSFLSLPSFAYADDENGDFIFGYNSLRVTKTFANLFESSDYRGKLIPKNEDGEYMTLSTEEGALFTKYRHKNGVFGLGNFSRIRISEMYLIEAEAEAELGDIDKAKTLLNTLQSKRGATETDATIDDILLERRKELFAEGHRLYDLKRRHLDLNRSDDPDHWATEKTISAGDYRFSLPIPLGEINANKAMSAKDQNKGY